MGGESPAKLGRTGPPARSCEELVHLLGVEAVAAVSGFDGAAQLLERRGLGVVEEGARDGGHGDGVEDHEVAGIERAGAVQANTGRASSPAGHDRDIDRAAVARTKLPERERRDMGQDRGRAAGENSSQPQRLRGEATVPDGVDAPMDAVKAASPRAAIDGGAGQPERVALRQRDDPVLPRGQVREAILGAWMF